MSASKFELLTRVDVQDYLAIFPDIVLDILEDPKWKDLGGTRQWAARVLFRNVPNEEIYHGLCTTLAVKHLVKGPSRQLLKDAYTMGWILQMFASCYMILDDIYDQSKSRHYKQCWYLEVGEEALNDVTLLESCVYNVLKRYFGTRPWYPSLVNTFHALSLKMAMSQTLEMELSKGKLDNFTLENYRKLVSYKMCFYPTRIHVLAAMHLVAEVIKVDAWYMPEITAILQKIDFHFQSRDDFMDVYGSNNVEEHEAETGTDIQERRCSWNICTALFHANPQQKQILRDNYGINNQQNVDAVKSVFEEIGLIQIFDKYQLEQFNEIHRLIAALPARLPKALFTDMMWASFPKNMVGNNGSVEDGDVGEDRRQLKEFARNIPQFLGVFPTLVSDLIESDVEISGDLGDLASWIGRLFQYNVPNGKKARGLTLVYAFKILAGEDATPEKIHQSYILGWCLEMFQAAALIVDDVMDASHKRRGRDCWYKVKEVGTEALNDSIILEAAVYRILKKYFGTEYFYLDLLDMFHQNLFKTALGQGLDVMTGAEMDLDKFTMERYSLIVKYKTSYYSFYLPVALSLLLTGCKSASFLDICKSYLLDIGHYFQVQDDFLDCYGSPETIGKVGTDIQDGKCSWLVISFLERATDEQRRILYENYGNVDPIKIQKVKDLYAEMKIQDQFYEFEEQTYSNLKMRLDELFEFDPEKRKLFQKILKTTYKRKL